MSEFIVVTIERVFLAHRFDFKKARAVLDRHTFFEDIFKHTPIRIVSLALEYSVPELNANDEQIVTRSRETIQSCSQFILDLSEPKWRYIGCLFEASLAQSMGIPIFCYTKSANDLVRPWLRHYCKHITQSLDELVEFVLVQYRNDLLIRRND